MRTSTKIKIAAALVIGLPVLGFINYYLPNEDVLIVTDTNVIRVDDNGSEPNDRPGATRDVYEIYADSLDRKTSYVFVNEDAPWYLKFDSASVQAKAASLAEKKARTAFVHIGWRIPIFSMIPNVISLKEVDEGYRPLPIIQTIFWVLLASLIGSVWFLLYRARQRRLARAAARAAEQARIEAERQASLGASERKAADDFINGDSK